MAKGFTPVEALLDTFTKRRKRRRALKRILLVVVAVLFATLLVLGVRLHSFINEDLSLLIQPNGASVALAHGEERNVTLGLQSNTYVFCKAECTARLVSMDGEEWRDAFQLGTQQSIEFPVSAPGSGSGKRLYRLVVECATEHSALCRREGKRSTAALVSLTYNLTDEERAEQQRTARILNETFRSLRELDIRVRLAQAQLEALDFQLSAAPLAKERDDLLREARVQRIHWEDGRYDEVHPVSVPTERGDELLGSIATSVELQHRLVEGLESAIAEVEGAARFDIIASLVPGLSGDVQENLDTLISLASAVQAAPMRDVERRLERLAAYREEREQLDGLAYEFLKREYEELPPATTNESDEHINKSQNESTDQQENQSDSDTAVAGATRERPDMNLTSLLEALETRCEGRTRSPCHLVGARGPSLNVTLRRVPLPEPSVATTIPRGVTTPAPECCAFTCRPCGEAATPILFLHGHSFYERNSPEYSLTGFRDFQQRLHEEERAVDAGVMTVFTRAFTKDSLSGYGAPLAFAGTYYYDAYLNGTAYILSAAKSESIDTYAIRLRDIVEHVMRATGAPNVTIVAHSMGGLVARRYADIFGDKHVGRLITIATPHEGINASAATLCPVLGADKECEEMSVGSLLLSKLKPREVAAIATDACPMGSQRGDGIVTLKSAAPAWSDRHVVNASCTASLHNDLLDPEETPEVYQLLVELLPD